MENLIITKICKDCGQTKEINDFVYRTNLCLECNIVKRTSGIKKSSDELLEKKKQRWQKNKDKYKQKSAEWRLTDRGIKIELLKHARNRAKKSGREFNLSLKDIDSLPETCPVLGIKLTKGVGKTLYSSYTIDRIDSDRGYTPDNVQIISARANMLKNNASLAELEAIVAWMKQNSKNSA